MKGAGPQGRPVRRRAPLLHAMAAERAASEHEEKSMEGGTQIDGDVDMEEGFDGGCGGA